MRREKQIHMESIKDLLDQYESFLVMSYLSLTANQVSKFRRDVAKVGGNIEILPKRMLAIAAKKAGLKLDLETMTGHIGVVFTGTDPLETTKIVYDFRKGNESNLQVVAGQIEGSLLSGEQVDQLAKLPGKQEMRAQLLGTLQAPLQQTLSVMNALIASVVYCLDNKSKQNQG